MQAFAKKFLCLALLLPFQVMIANTPVQPCEVQAKSQFVYLSTEMRRAVECLHRMLPEHKWSPEFKDVCDRIAKDGIAAPAEQAEAVVVECLNVLVGQNCAELQEVQEAIKHYAEALRNGDACIVIVDDAMMTRACGSCNNDCNTNCNSKCIKYKGTKAFCNLFAQDLQVPGSGYIANLTSNQFRVTGDAVISGNLTVDGEIFTTDEEINFIDLVVDNLTVNGIFTTNGLVNMGTNASDDTINIGTNASAGRNVNIGNVIGTSTTTILGDTSSLVLGNTGTASLNASGTVNIANDNATQTVNIATGTPLVKTVNIANGAGSNVVNLANGAGAPIITIGSATAASITENALTTNIGTAGVAQTLNIGSGAPGVKTINVGTGAVANVISVGSATATSITENALTMNYGSTTAAQTLNIGTGSTGAKTINIGTGVAINNSITIGNAIAGTRVALNAAGNGNTFVATGTPQIIVANAATFPSATRVGRVTYTTNPAIGADTDSPTLTINLGAGTGVTANTSIIATTKYVGATTAAFIPRTITPAVDSFTIILRNIGSATTATTDSVVIDFWALN